VWFSERIPRTLAIFVIAAFIAFGVQPLATRLEEHKIPKPAAIAIVFLVLTILIVVGLLVIIPLTLEQIQALIQNAPLYISVVQSWLTIAQGWVHQHVPGMQLRANTFDLSQIGATRMSDLIAGAVASLGSIVVSTATGFFIAFSAIVLSVFFLLNDTQIAEGFVSMFPTRRRETARTIAAEVTRVFGSYISGQVIVSTITGAGVAIGTALIGFKFSLILGIITGVAYAIPVIGMVFAQLIALILCAPQGAWMILWVQVIMTVVSQISNNVFVPKIMGESVGVSPIGIMFASFAGGELFGIPGLLLGIPAAALVRILWKYLGAPWWSAQMDRPN
jgi:predicted PurR-regulated permease PerM